MVAIRNCKFLLAVTGWADSEGNEHSSCGCQIAAFGIGCKGVGIARGCSPLRDCPLHRSQVQLMGGRQLVLGTKSEFPYLKDREISFCFAVSSTLWVKTKKEVSL